MANNYTLSASHQKLISTITETQPVFADVMNNSTIGRYENIAVNELSASRINLRGQDITDFLNKLVKEAKENSLLEEEYPELKELKLRYERLLAEIKLEILIQE